MKESRSDSGRRRFLKGLLTGAGVAAALGVIGKKVEAAPKKPTAQEPVLYRRTEDVERYYRTLYN
ncbi:MAG: twin-arginine translocation signal domain-containing protein [Candidatus Methylomirabilales bacterium]